MAELDVAPGAPPRRPAPAREGAVLGALALGALAVRIPGFLAARHLHPDDGVYGMSAVAMRAGGVPFRDVFSSQGPLHLPIVFAGDLLGGRTSVSPRAAAVASGVACALLAYAIARRLSGGRAGGVLAAVLVATSGSVLWTTAPVTADGPMLAFVLAAFLAALRYRARPGPGAAALAGALAAGAILVKPALGFVSALPALVVAVSGPGAAEDAGHRGRDRRRDLVVAAATAAVLGLAVTAPFGFADVWDQAVRYQLDSQREQSVLANAGKVVTTLAGRDLLLVAAVVLAGLAHRGHRGRSRRGEGPAPAPRDGAALTCALLLWTGVVAVFLVLQPALWRNHVASLVPPLAFLVARRPPPARWLAVAALVAVPVHTLALRDVVAPPPYGGPTRAAYEALRALPDGAWAISDSVGLVWRAGRRTPDGFVDASIKQLQQGRITAARIAAAAGRPPVCGVLVWSARHWGSLPDLPGALAAQGYAPARRFEGQSGARVLYTRTPCDV